MTVADPLAKRAVLIERQAKVKSAFLLSLAFFAALNCYLAFFTPFQFDPYKYFYKGWAWWAMRDLRASSEMHNVALLGSSLIVSAVAGCDANYQGKSVDLTQYHKAVYLDHRLRTTFGGDFSTFNLALPGQMPSDAYLALRAMVNCAHRPDVVIYGVAPRDFLDSTLNSPVDTEPFKYFRRLTNMDDVANAMFRSPLAKLDWFLQRHIYLYGTSMDFRLSLIEGAQDLLGHVLPSPAGAKPFTWWDRTRLLPSYLPGELAPGAVMIPPIDEKTGQPGWKDNTKEYAARYKSPDPLTYRTQVFFLKQMAAFCRKERIELIVVNMPITVRNAMILTPQVYNNYRQAMRVVCFESGVTFFDLCDWTHYYMRDFTDTVHLSAFGGRKFMDQLVDYLAIDRRSSMAMSLAGKELERYIMANRDKRKDAAGKWQ